MRRMDEDEVLERVRTRLSVFGWRRMRMGNETTGYCLVGAVRAEVRWWHPVRRHRIYRRLWDALPTRDKTESKLMGLISWNDRQPSYRPVEVLVERARRRESA